MGGTVDGDGIDERLEAAIEEEAEGECEAYEEEGARPEWASDAASLSSSMEGDAHVEGASSDDDQYAEDPALAALDAALDEGGCEEDDELHMSDDASLSASYDDARGELHVTCEELWGDLSPDEALALAVHLSEEDEERRGALLQGLLEAEQRVRMGGAGSQQRGDDACDDDDDDGDEGPFARPEWADVAVDVDTPIGLGPLSAAQLSRDDACDDDDEREDGEWPEWADAPVDVRPTPTTIPDTTLASPPPPDLSISPGQHADRTRPQLRLQSVAARAPGGGGG